MSKLKVGDNVFYKGDEGIIREVMIDGKEDFYRVDVSKKSIHYLYEDELDLVTQKLNDNQKVVLEWLKAYADKDSGDYPMQTIFYMWDCIRSDRLGVKELAALRKLTRTEQFEVLAVFAQWGLEQGENPNGIN